MSRLALAPLVALPFLVFACSAGGDDAASSNQDIVQAPDAAPPAGPSIPDNLQWFRNSAEQHAAYLQSFRLAAANVDADLAAADAPARGSWGIITDADETILNNSQYQKEHNGEPYDPAKWSTWVQSKRSTATPGSVAYVKHVKDLGGHVFVVTNGAQSDCDAYTTHIHELGFDVDAVLCQTDTSDKNPRFQKVQAGTAVPGIGPQKVLVWTGDNINDFPNESQASRTDESKLADFGGRFVVMSNPMYGSWQGNPRE